MLLSYKATEAAAVEVANGGCIHCLSTGHYVQKFVCIIDQCYSRCFINPWSCIIALSLSIS